MSIRVMTAVWDNAGVQGSELLVLLALADWADDGGICWPAMSTLSQKARISERSAQRACRSLAEKGLLLIDDNAGPKGANRYMVLPAATTTSSGGGDNLAPPDTASEGVTPVTQGVTPVTPGGDTGVTRTVIEPPIEPSKERESANANATDGEGGIQDVDPVASTDRPGTADFEKRVMRFCNGRGFDAGPWPDWDTSSPGYIGRQMAALDAGQRGEAERWRDPYLLDMAHRGRKPVPVGVFLRDKLWTGLDDEIIARAEAIKAAKTKPADRPKPDGWAACMGPVGMAWLFAKLLEGPEDVPEADGPIVLRGQLLRAWPKVARFQDVLHQRGGIIFEPAWHAARDAMEPVPQGSDVLAAWKDAFEARHWPWLSAFDAAGVVYCPKGGPDGLEAFSDAVRLAAQSGDEGKAA